MARSKNFVPEEVLDKTIGLFLKKGYQASSMADLMLVTGLNKKSLYNEFGNKEALFLLALQRFAEQEKIKSGPILLKQPLGLSNIQFFFDYLDEHFSTTGCLLTLSLNEHESIPEAAREVLDDIFISIESGFLANLSALEHYDEKAKTTIARSLLIMMQGVSSLSRSSRFRQNNLDSISLYLSKLV